MTFFVQTRAGTRFWVNCHSDTDHASCQSWLTAHLSMYPREYRDVLRSRYRIVGRSRGLV